MNPALQPLCGLNAHGRGGNVINFDEETLEEGSIVCDKCGETLEFSLEDEEEDQ